MGRKSLFMSMGMGIFGIGMTSASFHGVGTHACWSGVDDRRDRQGRR